MNTEPNVKLSESIKAITESVAKFSESMRESLAKLSVDLGRSFEQTPDAIMKLSKYGWYVNLHMVPRDVLDLVRKLDEGDVEYVNKKLTAYYLSNIERIEVNLRSKYPNREHFFDEAFKNFRNKRYSSSILLLLTQVDGIAYDKTKKLFFTNDNKKAREQEIYQPEIYSEFEKINDSFVHLFLHPFKNSTAINDKIAKLDKYPSSLNRHLIMHGRSYDFGNYLNNIKVISFVSYFVDLVDDL